MARWYRYVEEAEWLDIEERGTLRPGPNSCGPGKWIAASEADAWRWGESLDARFPARVVVLDVDAEVVEQLYSVENLDGIGRAAYVEGADLTRVRVVGAREYRT